MRERTCRILDVRLPEQMGEVARGDNGRVDLNGKDRVVAFCLAVMGRRQYAPPKSIVLGKSVKPKISIPKRNRSDVYD